VIVIGVAGGTGSGKTTLVKALMNRFGDNISVLSHDNYYKRHDEMSYEERTHLNYDCPDAFDTEDADVHLIAQRLVDEDHNALDDNDPARLDVQHLVGAVVDGVVIRRAVDGLAVFEHTQMLDHHIGVERVRAVVIEVRVIVVEGIMIFVDKTLCDEMNIRIFVDADADVRLCRRIRRDVKKRGRSIDSVIDQYLTTVKPMHELYVEPSKKNANLIVPEGGKNLIALEMIINRIQRHIDGNAE